jgi:hypothetical protein
LTAAIITLRRFETSCRAKVELHFKRKQQKAMLGQLFVVLAQSTSSKLLVQASHAPVKAKSGLLSTYKALKWPNPACGDPYTFEVNV